MDSFAGFEAFARVVETGSFTAAAASLGSAKSSVSEAVRALEERLGARLLDRTTRRVRVTEAGAALYARCRRLLDDAAAARAEARASATALAGRLRVSAPQGFAQRFLVPALPAFMARHPAVTFDISESVEPVDLLAAGLDLAFRVSESPAPNLIVRRLGTARVVVVAAPGYLAARGAPERPADVARHRCVGFSPLAWRDTWRLGAEVVAVAPRLLTNSGESLRAAALAGLGLVALPEWMAADALAAGSLTQVLTDHPAPATGIFAVYPGSRLISPVVRAYVDHTVREMRARGLRP
ncbi:MAG: LysR family transcriptional regulator [Rhodospirillales bacterium]|nr:MAG: LysR family transcriptional regulator [Rhodospirillales bacterium]